MSDRQLPTTADPAAPRTTRRGFLKATVATAGMLAFGGLGRVGDALSQTLLPAPETSGIDHIVVLMMENRSFDHYLGWLPHADGRQAGLRYGDDAGVAHETYRLAPEFQGCGRPDPDHSYEGGRVEYNGGRCDGWLRAGDNDRFAIGYYTKQDLAFFGKAAPKWTIADRYFCSIMAPTYPNRVYQHAAQTDRITNTLELSTLPTIWDRLEEAGLEGGYYWSDVPFLALWGAKYLPLSRSFSQFIADAAAGTLPHVSFVEPRFLGAEFGLSGDDHPYADIRNGQAFMNRVYQAVVTSPAWSRTLLVFNYDEWGGFFDHVPPPTAAIPPADAAAGNQDGRLGFRVPCMVVSPFARRRHVSNLVMDHTSILRMIEWRFNLEPLTERDATANNLADALDFSRPNLAAKRLNVPAGPFGRACQPFSARAVMADEWEVLRDMSRGFGWPA